MRGYALALIALTLAAVAAVTLAAIGSIARLTDPEDAVRAAAHLQEARGAVRNAYVAESTEAARALLEEASQQLDAAGGLLAGAEAVQAAVSRIVLLTVLAAALIPVPWFYVTRTIAPDNAQVLLRLMAGTLVFGVTFSIGMFVGQNWVAQRFNGSLKLLIAMPVSKGSYILGSLLYSALSGAIIIPALFGFGLLAGVEPRLTWGLAPVLALAVLTMAGLTLFVVSFAPSQQVGNLVTGMLSLVLAALSPVYFTMEQSPVLLKLLGYVSPLRYAADGITKSLSGQTNVGFELAVLAGFALVTMALGTWRLPWRED